MPEAPLNCCCPHCGRRLALKDAGLAGKKIKCPKCAKPFLVESLSEEKVDTDVAGADVRAARKKRRIDAEEEAGDDDRPRKKKTRREDDDLSEDADRPRLKKKKKKAGMLPWVLAGVGVAAIAGVSLVLILNKGPGALGKRGDGSGDGPGRIVLEGNSDQFAQIFFADPNVGRAVVFSVTHSPKEGLKNIFDRYDLKNGKKIDGVVIPGGGVYFGPGQLALNADSTSLLSVGGNKLTMLSLADGKETAYKLELRARPGFAAFLDNSRLLTVYAGGDRRLWQMPENQEVYSVKGLGSPPGSIAGGGDPGHTALTLDRTTAAVYNDGFYELFETATGKSLSKTANVQQKPQSFIASAHNTAFSPDGKQLACQCTFVKELTTANTLLRWDVKTGAEVGRTVLPANLVATRKLEWWTPQLIVFLGRPQQGVTNLITKATVFDLEQQKVVEERDAFPGVFGSGSGDGRLWYATGNPPVLTALEPPSRAR